MIFSYNWLNSYFDDKLPPVDEMVEKLILHSFEIEGVEKIGDDHAIDIDVLSNRAHDCFSHYGIARELAVVLDMPVTIPAPEVSVDLSVNVTDMLEVNVQSDLVPRVTKRLITDITVGDSPQWLKDRLATRGQKSINNIVDATNYITFETGQPVHAFDYDKLVAQGDKKVMTVRPAQKGEPLTLLDGKILEMDDASLVWADQERALDLAGIKGGADSGVDQSTKRIVISACNFEPVNIRKTRQRHHIVTDASRHFEHGLTPELALLGNERVSQLIVELAGGTASEVIDIYPDKQEQAHARFKTHDVNRLIGTDLSDADVERILDRFKHANFDWEKDNDTYVIAVPPERLDVRALHEIVEEVARIHGYYNVETSMPPTDDFTPKVYKPFYYNALVKTILVGLGYSELYNYVMRDKGEVEIDNPLSSEMQFVRTNMLDTLEKNLAFNTRNRDLLGLDQIKIFELNKVATLNEEHWALGVGIHNMRSFKGDSEQATLEQLTKELEQQLGTTITMTVQQRNAGLVAEINMTELAQKLDTPDAYGEVLSYQSDHIFEPFSKYPVVTRDIALWVPGDTSSQDVLALLQQGAGDLLVRIRLIDEFKKDDRISYAYRLVFQSHERTLLDQEVSTIMESLYKTVAEKGYEVR